ncbi:MAG: heavy-metal-associated domain-containing protein [Clostridiales bacterium]|jgi:copper chaperone|nr:heavy-metal-associated domain-containing protein [Clostridiales bacterium]
MEQAVLKVDGMSCNHCVNAVTKAVNALGGIEDVSVDLGGKTVAVKFDPSKSSLEAIKSAIDGQGFEVIG